MEERDKWRERERERESGKSVEAERLDYDMLNGTYGNDTSLVNITTTSGILQSVRYLETSPDLPKMFVRQLKKEIMCKLVNPTTVDCSVGCISAEG